MAKASSGPGRWFGVWVAAGLAGMLAGVVSGQDYDFSCRACDARAADVARCEAIDPEESVTGLLFNPPGRKTKFVRSSCLQRLAVRYRDASLCAQVRERTSVFFDGSAISRAACQARVAEAARTDAPVLIQDIHRLAEVAFFGNGNGRDMDIHIGFSGAYAHRYALTVAMLDEAGTGSRILDSRERHIGAHTSTLRLLIRAEQMAEAARALAVTPPYRFRITLALVEPAWREVAQFAALGRDERQSVVERRVDPGTLPRDPADFPD